MISNPTIIPMKNKKITIRSKGTTNISPIRFHEKKVINPIFSNTIIIMKNEKEICLFNLCIASV